MKTEIISIFDPNAFEAALDRLRRGEVIAIPTDTVYGVAADGYNPRAIETLYQVKERPRDKPIPLLLSGPADLTLVAAKVPDVAKKLAGRFWPGALTLVLPAAFVVPPLLLARNGSIALRVPNHRVPRQLAQALGHPLAATSANLSGGPDPATAAEVSAQLEGRISLILDGGAVGAGLPSTVVDLSVDPPVVVRRGALPLAEIEGILKVIPQT